MNMCLKNNRNLSKETKDKKHQILSNDVEVFLTFCGSTKKIFYLKSSTFQASVRDFFSGQSNQLGWAFVLKYKNNFLQCKNISRRKFLDFYAWILKLSQVALLSLTQKEVRNQSSCLIFCMVFEKNIFLTLYFINCPNFIA